MYIILGILAAAALGGLFYLFFSPKSSGIQKKAALGALILSGAALIVCSVIIVVNSVANKEDPYAFPVEVEEIQTSGNSTLGFFVFLALLLGVFVFIVFIGIREKKKQDAKNAALADDDQDLIR